MLPLVPVLLSFVILVLPWLLRPRRHGARPEIHGILRPLWWANALYCTCLHRLELVTGRAPLPEHGPAILIANHTCGIDHMILQAGCRRVLGFMIAQEFYDIWLCGLFCRLLGCIPVKRDGRDVAATRAALRALKQGRVVPIFPEGRILPKSGLEIGPGKPGAAFIALRARVPVIPAYICGTPLTNDVFKSLHAPSNARIAFGAPIDLSVFPAGEHIDRETIATVTMRLMNAICDLRARVLPEEEPLSTVSESGPGPDEREPASDLGAVSGDSPALLRA